MKNKFGRLIALLLVAALLVLPLAGCGGDEEETSPSPSAPTEPSRTPTPEPSKEPVYVTEYIGTVYNVSSFLRVRAEPNTSGEVIGEAKQGDKFTVIEQNVDGGEWHRVSYSGAEGFVHGDYITIEAVQVEVIEP